VPRLIITNGDVTVAGLRAAGVEAQAMPWRDALHDGPVPGGLPLEELSGVRAQFVAAEFGIAVGDVARNFSARDAAARDHALHERIELWFEHDLYDQLQLIQVLDFFANERRTTGIFLVQSGDYLGAMTPQALRALESIAAPVSSEQFETAQRAWSAFTASTPEEIARQAMAEIPAHPHLAQALRRLLQELPAVGSGLSLNQERVLSAVRDAPRTVAELFQITQQQEDAKFLGDVPFFRILDRMAFAPTPLIAGLPFESRQPPYPGGAPDFRTFTQSFVRATDAGRAALAREFDHARDNRIDRWLGGTHLTPQSLWRRDREGTLAA
jgi:hypothetical protein